MRQNASCFLRPTETQPSAPAAPPCPGLVCAAWGGPGDSPIPKAGARCTVLPRPGPFGWLPHHGVEGRRRQTYGRGDALVDLDSQSPLQTLASRGPQESPRGLVRRADPHTGHAGSHRAVPAPSSWPTGRWATEARAAGSLLCVLPAPSGAEAASAQPPQWNHGKGERLGGRRSPLRDRLWLGAP